MTEPGPQAPHLDVDALADALAGQRPDDRHLASCSSCAGRLAELAAAQDAVVASLRALPDPELPAGLADRLDAAVRAEPALAADGAQVSSLPVRRGRRSWLQGVAAAVALVLAGGLGYGLLRSGAGGGGDSAASDSAAGGLAAESATAAPVRNDSGIDYADEAALRATLPRVLAGTATTGALDQSVPAPAVAAAPPPAGPSAPELSAPAGDAPAAGGAAGQAAPAAPVADPLARLRDPAGLASCLSALLPNDDPDARPLALDYASFRGQPALAVVLPDPDPARLAVFVVGAGCTAGDDRTLRYVRVDKP